MLQNQTPVRRWKQWLALPVLAGLVLVACQLESAQIEPVNAQSALSKNSSPAERQAWKEQVMKNVKKALRADSLATGGARMSGQNRVSLDLAIRRDATVELALTNETDSPSAPKPLNGSPKRSKVNFDHPDVIGSFGAQGKLPYAPIISGISEFIEELAQKGSKPDKVEDLNKPKVYAYVEQFPELPTGGGNAAIVKAIQDKLTYPKPTADRPEMEGRVFVSFTVETDGLVRDVQIVKGLGAVAATDSRETMAAYNKVLQESSPAAYGKIVAGNPGAAYDAAVVKAVQQLPRFNPGRQGGQAVAVSFTVPVQFAK